MVANKRGEDEGKLKARIELGRFCIHALIKPFRIFLYTCTVCILLFLFLYLHLICRNTSVFHRSLVF